MEIAELMMEVFFTGAAATAAAAGFFAVLYAVSRRRTLNNGNIKDEIKDMGKETAEREIPMRAEDLSGKAWTGEGGTQELDTPMSSTRQGKCTGLIRGFGCVLCLWLFFQVMPVPCAANGQVSDDQAGDRQTSDKTESPGSEKISLHFDEDTKPLCITEGVAGYDRTVWAVFSYRGDKTPEQIGKELHIRAADREGAEVRNAYHLGEWKEETADENGSASCYCVRICFRKDAVYTVRYLTEGNEELSGGREEVQGLDIDTGNPGLPLIFVIDRKNPGRTLDSLPENGEPSEVTDNRDGEPGDNESGDNESGDNESGDNESGDDESGDNESGKTQWTFTMHPETAAMNRHYVTKAADVTVTVGSALPFSFQSIRLYRNTQEIPLEENVDYAFVTDNPVQETEEKTVTLPAEKFEQDGVYRIVFTCRDTEGNEFSNSEKVENTLNFGVDSTPPVLEIQDLEENAVYDVPVKYISVIAEDNLKLISLEIFLDGQSTPTAAWDGEALKEMAKQRKLCSVRMEGDREQTKHTLRVVVQDEAGNVTEKQITAFYVRKHIWDDIMRPEVLAAAGAILAVIVILMRYRRKSGENTGHRKKSGKGSGKGFGKNPGFKDVPGA